jgi:ABC-type nitrate/sulfonate/bicarbonate transport system substrate-binding protein
LLLSHGTTTAADLLKLAIGQRGLWDSAIAEIGVGAGIFQKHNLELQTVYTSGGGETQQAVISGSVDIGVSPGMLGVLGAYAKGAPVRVIAGEATGTAEHYFVKTRSPVQKDFKGVTPSMTLAYSTNGSGNHGAALHEGLWLPGEAGRDRQCARDLHVGDVGPGRHRLLHSAVRPRGRRAGADQDRGTRQ